MTLILSNMINSLTYHFTGACSTNLLDDVWSAMGKWCLKTFANYIHNLESFYEINLMITFILQFSWKTIVKRKLHQLKMILFWTIRKNLMTNFNRRLAIYLAMILFLDFQVKECKNNRKQSRDIIILIYWNP